MSKFNVGIKVVALADGKVMVVEAISLDGKYKCFWKDKKGKVKRDNFSETALVAYVPLEERRTMGIFKSGLK